MFVSGELQSGKLDQHIKELGNYVDQLVSELQTDLLNAEEENKYIRKELEQSQARNKKLEQELEQKENQNEVLNQELEKSEAQNKEFNNVVLKQQTTLLSYEEQLKHVKNDLAQSEARTEDLKKELDQVASNATILVQHESRIEIMTEEHDSLIREYNQALKEQDLALVKLNTIGAELKETQKDLELGKKVLETERISLVEKLTEEKEVWDAEKVALAERLTKAKEVWDAERKGLTEMHTKAKEVWDSEMLALTEIHTKEKEVWEAQRVALAERFRKVKELWEAGSGALAERIAKSAEVWEAEKMAEYPLYSRKRVKNINSTSNNEQGEKRQPKCPCKFQQLSQALVIDILSRLPVKSLFNCRCVCKPWHVLISDSHFAHLHHTRSPIGILIHTYSPEGPSRELDFSQTDKSSSSDSSDLWLEKIKFSPDNSLPVSKFRLWNTCNGLVCLSGPERDGCCYVCNPILGEFITIPYGGQCRAFVGLGFSSKTNQCKLLRISNPVITPRFCSEASSSSCDSYRQAEVYTLGTGIWRSIGIVPNCGSSLKAPFDAILHGALHWVSFWGKSSDFIHSFDFEREEFQQIPPPRNFGLIEKQYTDSLKLGLLRDCLILSVFADDSSRFDMWVMKDYCNQDSWTKSVVIENVCVMELSFVCYEPIMILSNGDILMLNDDDPRVVVCYNQEAKSFRETRITSTTLPLYQFAYCPSFLSLHDVSKGEEVKRVRDLRTSC